MLREICYREVGIQSKLGRTVLTDELGILTAVEMLQSVRASTECDSLRRLLLSRLVHGTSEEKWATLRHQEDAEDDHGRSSTQWMDGIFMQHPSMVRDIIEVSMGRIAALEEENRRLRG